MTGSGVSCARHGCDSAAERLSVEPAGGLLQLFLMRRVSAGWSIGRHSTALTDRHAPVGLSGVVLIELSPGSRHLRRGFHIRWFVF